MSRYRTESKIDTLIIHCAATPNGQPFTSEQIDTWHAQRGFKRSPVLRKRCEPDLAAIGYHFVIYANGAVRSARHIEETGAHARGYNLRSIGTCLIGTDQFSRAQWHALKSHINSLQNRFNNRLNVVGHRELPEVKKSCPGFDVAAYLDNRLTPFAAHILAEPCNG